MGDSCSTNDKNASQSSGAKQGGKPANQSQGAQSDKSTFKPEASKAAK